MNLGRNDPCWCGSGKKWKKCHAPEIPHQDLADQYLRQYHIRLKTPKQIEGIRAACRLAAKILDETCKAAKKGVTTNELDDLVRRLHRDAGAIPAPLGYGEPPFPNAACYSLNEVICHGMASDRPLQEGDIVNIDVSSNLHGYFGDCSRMVTIGSIDADKKRVVDTSYECLMRSISILKPGVLVSDIGDVIEDYATANNCSVVYQFVGHGCGLEFHEPPQVPHNRNKVAIPLAAGMTFTIEPMINAGKPDAVIDRDGWTARTIDGKPSAQWEHMVLITEDGHDILTLLPR